MPTKRRRRMSHSVPRIMPLTIAYLLSGEMPPSEPGEERFAIFEGEPELRTNWMAASAVLLRS